MHTLVPLPVTARPWSPRTDWGRTAALRYMHAMRQIKVAIGPTLHVSSADAQDFPEGPQVLAVHRDTHAHLKPGIQICAPIQRIDAPDSVHELGPFQVLLFADRTGLVLRHLVLPYHDLLSLPIRPFLWGDKKAATPFDPVSFWRPVSNAPKSLEAQDDAFEHARLFPRWHSLDNSDETLAGLENFLERVAHLQRICPWMPADMDLYGGCGDQGPYLSLAQFSQPPEHPVWPALRDALDALAQRFMPGIAGLAQSWATYTPVGKDPRVSEVVRRVPLDSDTPFSAHQRLALHQDLWGVGTAALPLPLPA